MAAPLVAAAVTAGRQIITEAAVETAVEATGKRLEAAGLPIPEKLAQLTSGTVSGGDLKTAGAMTKAMSGKGPASAVLSHIGGDVIKGGIKSVMHKQVDRIEDKLTGGVGVAGLLGKVVPHEATRNTKVG